MKLDKFNRIFNELTKLQYNQIYNLYHIYNQIRHYIYNTRYTKD